MYLMDGEQRIMNSYALNESDRLSGCSKRIRSIIGEVESPFNVYVFQTGNDDEAGESPDDFNLNYNVNGIRMSEAAYTRLRQEISLEPCRVELPELWGTEGFRLITGLVPVGNDIFRKIVVRASRVPRIDLEAFSLKQWTDRWYYEVCSTAAVYAPAEARAASAGTP